MKKLFIEKDIKSTMYIGKMEFGRWGNNNEKANTNKRFGCNTIKFLMNYVNKITTMPWIERRTERIQSIHCFLFFSTLWLKRTEEIVRGTISWIPNTYISKSLNPSCLINAWTSSSSSFPFTFHVPERIRRFWNEQNSFSLYRIFYQVIYQFSSCWSMNAKRICFFTYIQDI